MPITAHVKVDKRGRITIPAAVRREMGIGRGDTLILRANADGAELCTLSGAIHRLKGCMKGTFGSMDEIMAYIREERDSWDR